MWKRVGWTVFALALAYPAVLALIPATRWAVLSRTRVAFERDENSWASFDDYRAKLPIVDRASELAALDGVGHQDISSDDLYAATRRNWRDPLYLAQFLSRAVLEARPPKQTKMGATALGDNEARRTWQRIIEVSDQGSKIDGGNAFFPAMAAAAAQFLGDETASRAYLKLAGSCTRFDSYAAELSNIYQRAAIRAFGYRGWEVMPAANQCGWTEYLCSLCSEVGSSATDAAGIRARADALRVADLIYDSAREDTEINAAAGLLRRLTGTVSDPRARPSQAREQTLQGLATLARLLQPSGPEPLDKRMRLVVAAGDHVNIDRVMNYPSAPAWEGILEYSFMDSMGEYASISIACLTAALLAFTALCVVAPVPGRAPLRWMPFLAAAALSMSGIFIYRFQPDGLWQAIGFAAFYLVAGWIATYRRAERYGFGVALVIPVIALAALLAGVAPTMRTDMVGYLVVPVVAFPLYVCLYAWRERRGTSTKLFILPQFAFIAFGFGMLVIVGFPAPLPLSAARFLVLLTIAVVTVSAFQGVSFAESARQMRRYAYWPTAAAGICCGLALMGYVWQDASCLRQIRAMQTSAIAAREWARQHPDGLLPELRQLDLARGRD